MSVPATLRAVVVDDSPTARALLTAILAADPAIRVVGEASNGLQALEVVKRTRPSVVVMDIEMPVMDGFEATKRIMVEEPTPIVIVSARYDSRQVEVALQAVKAGALTVIAKPSGPATPGFQAQSDRIVRLVKALAEVKVVRQHRRRPSRRTIDDHGGELPRRPRQHDHRVKVVGVAASTGGPAALYRFLEQLPRTLGIPVLVVQHIADGFVDGLARWLGGGTLLPVGVAKGGSPLRPGEVYLAPDGHHLEVGPNEIRLSSAAHDGGFRPSANVLFASLAARYGPRAAAVVLTGMGTDGLRGAAQLRACGGLVLAQDADSSAVFGMPRAVAEAGLAHAVGDVADLASLVVRSSQETPP